MKNRMRWFLVLLCFVFTSICLFVFPEKVILHYDLKGNMDWEGSKYFCYIFPGIIFSVSWLIDIIIKSLKKKIKQNEEDKENQEIQNNINILEKLALVMISIFDIISVLLLYLMWRHSSKLSFDNIDFFGIITDMISFLLIFMGNIITKAKMNSVIGVRTQWSMYNERTWKKSNFICGICMILAGFVSVVISIMVGGWISELIMFLLILAVTFISCIVSYNEFCKEQKEVHRDQL